MCFDVVDIYFYDRWLGMISDLFLHESKVAKTIVRTSVRSFIDENKRTIFSNYQEKTSSYRFIYYSYYLLNYQNIKRKKYIITVIIKITIKNFSAFFSLPHLNPFPWLFLTLSRSFLLSFTDFVEKLCSLWLSSPIKSTIFAFKLSKSSRLYSSSSSISFKRLLNTLSSGSLLTYLLRSSSMNYSWVPLTP